MTRFTVQRFALAALFAVLIVPVAIAAPSDALSVVPKDAVSVGVIRLGDLRSGALASLLLEHTDKVGGNGEADTFLRDAGLDPKKDIDLLVVAASPQTTLGSEADLLVVAEGRFNVERLTTTLINRGAKKLQTPHGSYLTTPDKDADDDHNGAVAFPSSRLAFVGTERAVVRALADRAAGGSGFLNASLLSAELGRIDRNATAWALVDVARARRLSGQSKMPNNRPESQAINAALRSMSTVAVWATETADALKLNGLGIGSDTETLSLLEDTLRGGLAALRLGAQERAPEMVSVLRRFEVTRTNDSIGISGSIPIEALRNTIAKHKSHAAK